LISTRKPAFVSCRWTTSRSPGFIRRSVAALGTSALLVKLSIGPAGACAAPLRVIKAKLTGSSLTLSRQALLLSTSPAGLSAWLNESMFIAAHHFVAEQLTPAGHDDQPGG